jgi:hypothetical protein
MHGSIRAFDMDRPEFDRMRCRVTERSNRYLFSLRLGGESFLSTTIGLVSPDVSRNLGAYGYLASQSHLDRQGRAIQAREEAHWAPP